MPHGSLLAVDVGTSSCRAVLYGLGGEVVQTASAPGPAVAYPQPGWAEQSADAVWIALVQVLQELMRRVGPGARIAGMAVTAQIGTVCVDDQGRPVAPLMNWMDTRAVAEAAWIAAAVGEAPIYRASGKRLDPERDACRLLWLRRNRPEAWSHLRWAYSLKDFLVHRLTGRPATDPIHASYSLLADTATGDWNGTLCAQLGIDPGTLPPILSATAVVGRITPEIAAATGLPVGLPVAGGGPDGSLGTLGAGLARVGDAVLVMGTSDVFFVCAQNRVSDPERRVLAHHHILPDLWLVGGPQGLAGGALQWLVGLLGDGTAGERQAPGTPRPDPGGAAERWAALEAAALGLDPGADRLLVQPALLGERAPVWEAGWRGAVVGLTPAHGGAHLLRAFAEGLAYGTLRFVREMERVGCRPARILAVGGGARTALRPRITADVTGLEVVCVANPEATSAGVAICAGIAAGLMDFDQAVKWARIQERHQPDPGAHAAYQRLYPLWERWQSAQRSIFADLASL